MESLALIARGFYHVPSMKRETLHSPSLEEMESEEFLVSSNACRLISREGLAAGYPCGDILQILL
jgi:hypothetical protein